DPLTERLRFNIRVVKHIRLIGHRKSRTSVREKPLDQWLSNRQPFALSSGMDFAVSKPVYSFRGQRRLQVCHAVALQLRPDVWLCPVHVASAKFKCPIQGRIRVGPSAETGPRFE